MAFYSKAHYRLLSNGDPDKPGDAAKRIALREAGEQAHREMLEKFAPLTAQNARAAIDWQERRIRELSEAVR
jgi:hypothetical protein